MPLSPLLPADLRCEYLRDPLGIDITSPRLMWRLDDPTATRGQHQTACRVLVASRRELLDEDRADLWDSGKLDSSVAALEFAGQPLASGQDCYWKVMVFDRDGRPSAWSEVARFSIGPLRPEDWTGPWIRHPDAAAEKHVWFRGRLRLDAAAESAFIHVASAGYHELRVNGRKADDRVLAPGQTRLDKRVLYVAYDVTSLLREGDNVIAIWQGPGWSRYEHFRVQPALRVQIQARTVAGKEIVESAGTHWRCTVSGGENIGWTAYGDNGGEQIDARRHIADWDGVDFDDSDWACAREVHVTAALSAHMVEPTRVLRRLSPASIDGVSPCKIDVGVNFTGWIELRLRGPSAGDELTIKVSDSVGTDISFQQQSRYIARGADGEVFINRFNYAAGRYITVEGLKQPLAVADVTAHVLGTDLERTGRFSCSNELFNRIYETDLWTFQVCTIEGYTADCPHRERLGYGEVAFACSWGIGLPNYHAGAFYTKYLRDWADVQEENGWIHHTVPQVNQHFGGPLWSSGGIQVAMEFYRCRGDRRLLDAAWAPARKWLDFLALHAKDGLLHPYDAHWGRFLGDWSAPHHRHEKGDSPEALLFNNCVYVMNLADFIALSEIIGKTEGLDRYRERLAKLKSRVHEHFFDPERKTYGVGRQMHQIFPLLVGIVPEDERAAVVARFEEDIAGPRPWLDMGSSGLPVMLKYLVEHTRRDELLAELLAKTSYPSYGYFLSQGETAWPEYWDIKMPSRMHTCYTGIAGWFTKSVCGIRPDPERPGGLDLLISPAILDRLSHAEGVVESAAGPVSVRWDRNAAGTVELAVTIPPGARATVHVPANAPAEITESGRRLSEAAGVTVVRNEERRAVLALQSGRYVFSSRLG